jgi:hypothetical protein
MFEIAIGAAALLGFAGLGSQSLIVGSMLLIGVNPIVRVLKEGSQTATMLKPQKMAQVEADTTFARQKRSAEDVSEYVSVLTEMGMAIGLTIQFPTISAPIYGPEGSDKEDVVVDHEILLALGEGESEDDQVSVRAAKRRYNLAAKELGFDEFAWREKKGWLFGRVTRTLAQKKAEAEAQKAQVEAEAAKAQAEADIAEDEEDAEEDEAEEDEEVTTTSVASVPPRRRRR